ncbi:uncharacterized protein LOC124423395 [Vespa crabro]|uniref:uncharacterized protein LOC124423395 n=1 Tax=Vespa crabro TaxID=7445 RepID=UPI001F02605E|nr:uncharacterized protein LOC124423395 [Vespa crabro]
MQSKEEDYINNEYYALNLQFLRLIGLWEYHSSLKQQIYICSINIIILIGLSQSIYMFFTSEPKINLLTELLETILPTLCFGSCYWNLLLKDTIMKNIMRRINCDWMDFADKPELIILKKYANISRQSTIIIAISFYIYIILLIFPSLLRIFQYVFGVRSETKLILPIRTYYFTKNQLFYFITLLYEYIALCITCMIGVANYSMFIAIIQHACALFNIIEWRVNEYLKKIPDDNYRPFTFKEENEWIVDTIELYNNALKLVSNFIRVHCKFVLYVQIANINITIFLLLFQFC